MPSARTIVEDSDDEADLLSPHKDTVTLAGGGDTHAAENTTGIRTNGTSSTEELKRDIQKAHSALFGYESTRKRDLAGADEESRDPGPPTARTKRRRTTNDKSSPALLAGSQERKSVTVYSRTRSFDGSRATQDLRHVDGIARICSGGIALSEKASPPHEDGKANGKTPRSSHERQLQDDATAWNMRGSLLQDFAEHEPMAMFASGTGTGSTVPDNTGIQRKMIRDALGVHEEPSCPPKQSPTLRSDCSLPSSAFRTTQATTKSPSAIKSSTPTQRSLKEPKSSQVLHGDGTPLKQASNPDSQGMLPPILHGGTPSQCSKTSPRTQPVPVLSSTPTEPKMPRSTTPLGSPTPGLPGHMRVGNVAEVEVDATAPHVFEQQASSKQRSAAASQPQEASNAATEASEIAVGSARGEANMALPQTAGRRRRRRNEAEALEQLDRAQTHSDALDAEDLAAIGLPKEQYKPRPSRSRSAQVPSLDDLDLTINPERASKRRNRRRKTVDGKEISSGEWGSQTSKVNIISNMGFTPARAKKALTTSNGNIEDAIDALIGASSVAIAIPTETTEQTETAPQPVLMGDLDVREIATALKDYSRQHQSRTPHAELAEAEERGTRASRVSVSVQIPIANYASRQSDGTERVRSSASSAQPISQSGADEYQAAWTTNLTHDAEDQANDDDNEACEPPVIKRKRGRPKAALATVLTEDEAAEIEARGEVNETAIHAEPPHAAGAEGSEPPPRRGRGHPRSVKASDALMPIHHDQPQRLEPKRKGGISATSTPNGNTVLQELDKNVHTAAKSLEQMHDDHVEAPESERRLAQTITPASSPVRPPSAAGPTTPARQKTAATTQHSPISKGKVPYRVGLSRHARIPSLLKMMKK